MPTIQEFLQELDHEATTTRRVLERVPEDRFDWRPHHKSMSLGQLADHIARIPLRIAGIAKEAGFDAANITPPGSPASAEELLATFDSSLAGARNTIGSMSDADLAGIWRMTRDGKELMAMARGAVLRNILFNHWYHHRGQLTVYLRLNDVPLPSVYGPTADLRV
ncbi:MAG TPA: DinB family protein [Gemmatimonadales bacterium]|nr:DinB family protein [Gemmatimonadales bacterium]